MILFCSSVYSIYSNSTCTSHTPYASLAFIFTYFTPAFSSFGLWCNPIFLLPPLTNFQKVWQLLTPRCLYILCILAQSLHHTFPAAPRLPASPCRSRISVGVQRSGVGRRARATPDTPPTAWAQRVRLRQECWVEFLLVRLIVIYFRLRVSLIDI